MSAAIRINWLEYSSMVILSWKNDIRVLHALSFLLDSLNCNLNLSKKFAHIPRFLGVSAPTVLARKFSAQVLAVPCLIHERTRETLSKLVLYRSASTAKRRRH